MTAMPKVTRTTNKVIADHIRYLGARTNTRALVDTTDGIALVEANNILADGSNVTRLLLTKTDLRDAAGAANQTLTEYLDANATTIAAELNDIRNGEDDQP
ncbi:hypothetical protein ABT336_11965 [Micromonospora sp. NPDC000207]|uniref:hypothetical protein n=1 Tax=Micromonospora sp. NPDC000207 TaxID=3154246 RepID=UPI00332F94C6